MSVVMAMTKARVDAGREQRAARWIGVNLAQSFVLGAVWWG